MRGGRLVVPVPDAVGIYSFPSDILTAHEQWQRELASSREGGLIELIAPLSGKRYLVKARTPPSGKPIMALEPHHDDLILSAGGYLLTQRRPLTVVTVFTRSNSVHPDISTTYASVDEISRLRAEESRQAFRTLQATHHMLGMKDADPPYKAYDPRDVDQFCNAVESLVRENGDADLIAPAGVTRHPDHLLVHEAARRLGCRWFWDDTAFYPTYAANVNDQHLFELRTKSILEDFVEDITNVVLDKLTLLHMYQSQMQPVREMYRVLRYNWTVAAKMLAPAANADLNRFAERFFKLAGNRT